MEDILTVVFLFGGGFLTVLAFSPIGKALAARIRGETPPAGNADPAVYEELDRLRQEMNELQERVDFTERVLAQRDEPARIEGQPNHG
jgi:hypothetical protein